MKQRLSLALMTCCLILLVQGKRLCAQMPQSIDIGPYVGMSTSINDINTWKVFNEFDLTYGGVVRFNYDARWAFRLDYTHSVVKGTDTIAGWRPERNLSFRSVVNDVSLMVEFNFLDFYGGKVGKTISPYIFAGGSVFRFKTAPNLNRTQRLELAHTTDSIHNFHKVWDSSLGSGTSFSIPFGVGCKFALTQYLTAAIEWKMQYTFTDDLDGIHDPYPNPSENLFFISQQTGVDKNGKPIMKYYLSTDNTNPGTGFFESVALTDPTGNYHAGQQRGNSESNDWFGSLSFSLTWKIPLPGGSACKIITH